MANSPTKAAIRSSATGIRIPEELLIPPPHRPELHLMGRRPMSSRRRLSSIRIGSIVPSVDVNKQDLSPNDERGSALRDYRMHWSIKARRTKIQCYRTSLR